MASWNHEKLTKTKIKEYEQKLRDLLTMINDDGTTSQIYAGWTGYFESLSRFDLEQFTMMENPEDKD